MADSNYDIIANTFTVVNIAQPLTMHVSVGAPLEEVQEEFLMAHPDEKWCCLVRDEARVVAFLTFDDEVFSDVALSEPVGAHANPITPDHIVPAALPLFELVPLFEKHFFFFVLSRNEITHVVSFVHLDALPMKLSLFSLFLEMESEMLAVLRQQRCGIEECLRRLSNGRREKAQKLCRMKYERVTPERELLCTTFIDKKEMLRGDDALYGELPFDSRSDGDRFFKTVERVRNQIAHSDSVLSVLRKPGELNSFVARIRAVTESLSGLRDTEASS